MDGYRLAGARSCLALFILTILCGSAGAQGRFGMEEKKEQPTSGSNRFGLGTSSGSARSMRFVSATTRTRFGIQQVGEDAAEAVRQVVARPAPSGPEALVARADRLVEQGDATAAIEIYRKAIGMQPQLVSARLGLGYALIKVEDYDGAAREFQEAIATTPANSEAQLNLGVALYRSGRIEEAIRQYERVIAVGKSSNATAHFNLAMAYAHKGEFAKAIEQYRAALQERGNYPEAYNNLGLIYEAMDELDKAAEQFRLAIEQRRGRYPLAHYNLARYYHVQKRYQEAIGEFQQAIKIQPNFPEAYLDLGNIYLLRATLQNTNEFEAAIAAYRKAIELRKNNYALAHENLAIALTKVGKKQEAVAEYRIAFDQYDGECPETMKNLLATIQDKRSFLIGNELSRADNAGNLKSAKSAVGKLADRVTAVMSDYEELDDELKDAADVRYCAGRLYLAGNQWGEAADEFARALERSGNKDADARAALNELLELVKYF